MDVENLSSKKLMKKVEIRRIYESEDPDLTNEELIEITEEFLHIAIEKSDFRYLNTALKLNDYLREQLSEQKYKSTRLKPLKQEGIAELKKFVGLK